MAAGRVQSQGRGKETQGVHQLVEGNPSENLHIFELRAEPVSLNAVRFSQCLPRRDFGAHSPTGTYLEMHGDGSQPVLSVCFLKFTAVSYLLFR